MPHQDMRISIVDIADVVVLLVMPVVLSVPHFVLKQL